MIDRPDHESARQVVSALCLAVFCAAALALLVDAAVFAQSAPPLYPWTTIAGRASMGLEDGPALSARFHHPMGLAYDPAGNLYIADTGNHPIRKLAPTGFVSTLAGSPGLTGSADGLGNAARFVQPLAIAVDALDNLYVGDGGYRSPTIRKGQLAGPPIFTAQPQSVTVTAGTSVQSSVTASGVPAPTYQWRFNGAAINGATGTFFSGTSAQTVNAGQYTVIISNALGSATSSAATLTVNHATAEPPSSGSGGAGGGGAMGTWSVGLLVVLAAARALAGRSLHPHKLSERASAFA